MFAKRAGFDLTPNALASRLAGRRAEGLPLLDLTESNPTRCAFPSTAAALQEALERLSGDPRTGVYAPDPKGAKEARAAVAAYHGRRAAAPDPSQIVLTAGTSEAYAHLFRLLADPGDEVLIPKPGYPLFEHLAAFEGVRPRTYPLHLDGDAGWRIDLDALRAALSPRTRALLVVDPNNPTGSFVARDQAEALRALCRERGIALLCDEVFADYVFEREAPEPGGGGRPPALLDGGDDADAPLGFVLSGLSKTLGLPQLKVAWIVARGPRALRDEALARLELIADTFLSVSALAQACVPEVLRHRSAVQSAIGERLRENRAWLASELRGDGGVELLPADGGWYAVLRMRGGDARPAPDEERLVLDLLDDAGVLVHPGYFYDFPQGGRRDAHFVASLLGLPETFQAGSRALLAALRGARA